MNVVVRRYLSEKVNVRCVGVIPDRHLLFGVADNAVSIASSILKLPTLMTQKRRLIMKDKFEELTRMLPTISEKPSKIEILQKVRRKC